ncbi:MAG: MerR family transcriptional regulator [Candidatus Wallbacteria bacterium]
MKYNIMDLAEKTGMSVKLVRYYLEKYQLEENSKDLLSFDSYTDKHIKMLTIVKEINKSKYFSQPLATHYIQQIKNNNYKQELPDDGVYVLNRVASLLQEVSELTPR